MSLKKIILIVLNNFNDYSHVLKERIQREIKSIMFLYHPNY